jgi:hypothetical protein
LARKVCPLIFNEGLVCNLPTGARQEKLSAVLAFDKFVNNVKAHAIMARAFAFYFKGNHFN